MSDPIWSRSFARRVAQVLGYRFPGPCDKPGLVDPDADAEQLVEQLTEAFRYLPAEQVGCALDFAEFLRGKIDSDFCTPPAHEVAAKLREMRDLVLSLRDRFGTREPADEKDYWTEEDERDLTLQTWRHLEAEDPWPEEDSYLREEQRDAESR